MPEITLNVNAKIKIYGKDTVLAEELWNDEKFKVIAAEFIDCSLRPRAIALHSYDNLKKKVKGKIFSNTSTDYLIGLTNTSVSENKNIYLISKGYIQDNGLSGTKGDPVYVNSSGYLTLTPTICKVGKLINTSLVYLNIGINSSNSDLNLLFNNINFSFVSDGSPQNSYQRFLKDFNMDFSDVVALPFTAKQIAHNGSSTFVIASSTGLYYSTDNCSTWTLGQAFNWDTVTYVNSLFIATRSTAPTNLATSPDGINWTLINMGTTYNTAWGNATYGNGLYVAIGQDGIGGPPPSTYEYYIYTSVNGSVWVQNPLPPALNYPNYLWSKIAFGNNTFVALSGQGIMYSTEAINWTLASLPGNSQWVDLKFINNKFIAIGNYISPGDVQCMSSVDGINWVIEKLVPYNTVTLNSISFGNGYYFSGDLIINKIEEDNEAYIYSLGSMQDVLFYNNTIYYIESNQIIRIPF